jgi:hypothetical protein
MKVKTQVEVWHPGVSLAAVAEHKIVSASSPATMMLMSLLRICSPPSVMTDRAPGCLKRRTEQDLPLPTLLVAQ